jgi:DNA-binding response OmpR family regulator
MQPGLILLRTQGVIFREAFKLYFQQWGFEVRELSSPETPLREVLRQQPVMIVLDLPLRLPAYNLEEDLLGEGHQIPLLLLATSPVLLKRHFLRLQKVYHYDCIPKPCPLQELKRAVEGLLGCSLPEIMGWETERAKPLPSPGE